MTLTEVLMRARRAGIVLEAQGEHLVIDAPAGSITPDLRDALKTHKSEILLALTPPPRFVTLLGGLTVPEAAIQLALELEARGIPLRTDAEHQFLIPSDASLTERDHAAIRRWRQHLGAIVEYTVPERVQ